MPHPAALGGDSEEAVSDINDMLLSGPIPDEVAEWAPEKVATPLTTEEVAAVSMGLPWHDIPRTVGTTTGKSVDFYNSSNLVSKSDRFITGSFR